MVEMEYSDREDRKLLAHGKHKKHDFFVISLGTHPCAYVQIDGKYPKHLAEGVYCHGGVTYHENYLILPDGKIEGEFIGWDYAHCGDYIGYCDSFCIGDEPLKQYTTSEMIADCINVINRLTEGRYE